MRSLHAQPWLLALLSGGCIGLTLLPYDAIPWMHVAIFFGYVPLFLAWMGESSKRRIFLLGWITQFVLTAIAFPWIAYTLRAFAHFPDWLSWLGLGAFCALAYLFIPFAGLIWFWLFPVHRFSKGARLAGMVVVLALAERIYPSLFHWHLGTAWIYLGGPAYQSADAIGFQGLGTFTLVVNGLVAFALTEWRRGKAACLRPLLLAAFAYSLLCAYGWWRVPRLDPPNRSARILVVQANIGNKQKIQALAGAQYQRAIVEAYAQQSLEALAKESGKVDLVVWAETAYPALLPPQLDPSPALEALLAYLASSQVPLATGAFGLSPEGKATNNLFLLPPDGKSAAVYTKSFLMPFGEFMPGGEWFPFLKSAFPGVRDYGRGEGPKVIGLNDLNLGPQICYEAQFDEFARRSADQGADLLLNLTNDSWYGPGAEPLQHFYLSMGRAIETRRPFLRATNTGVSAVILADGTQLPWIPQGVQASRLYDIPYRKAASATPFMRFGYWAMPALLWMVLGGLLVFGFARRPRLAA